MECILTVSGNQMCLLINKILTSVKYVSKRYVAYCLGSLAALAIFTVGVFLCIVTISLDSILDVGC